MLDCPVKGINWPWAWNGKDAVAPSASEEDDLPAPDDPVYRVRVRGTTELELVWEIVQPHDEADHFSVAVRRKIGLVRLSADERNDRDLRLVYGSALDRLLVDSALRARIGKRVSDLDLHDSLNQQGKEAIKKLDERMIEAALPRDLKLGLTTSQGLSIGALIGLLATKNGVSLPVASWGAGNANCPFWRTAGRFEIRTGVRFARRTSDHFEMRTGVRFGKNTHWGRYK